MSAPSVEAALGNENHDHPILPAGPSEKAQTIFKIILNELFPSDTCGSDRKVFVDEELKECISLAKQVVKDTEREPQMRRALERSNDPGWNDFYDSVRKRYVGITFSPQILLMDATFMDDSA